MRVIKFTEQEVKMMCHNDHFGPIKNENGSSKELQLVQQKISKLLLAHNPTSSICLIRFNIIRFDGKNGNGCCCSFHEIKNN